MTEGWSVPILRDMDNMTSTTSTTNPFLHRLDPSLGSLAVLYNDLGTILSQATRVETPKGDTALTLSVLSGLSAAVLRAACGDRRQLAEMCEWCCAAGQRANARWESGQ